MVTLNDIPISGTLSATGVSDARYVLPGSYLNLTLSGVFVGKVVLERSFDGGQNWSALTALGQPIAFAAPASEVFFESQTNVMFRLNFTRTSGAVNYLLSQGNTQNLLVDSIARATALQNRNTVQAVTTDVAFTLTPSVDDRIIVHTGTLTADRAVTLSTVGAYEGTTYKITRTGAGAFNLLVGGLKSLATNTWCEVVYSGTAWTLISYGTL